MDASHPCGRADVPMVESAPNVWHPLEGVNRRPIEQPIRSFAIGSGRLLALRSHAPNARTMSAMKRTHSFRFPPASDRRNLPRAPGRDRSLISALPQAIVTYGADGEIVEANPAAVRILNLVQDPS